MTKILLSFLLLSINVLGQSQQKQTPTEKEKLVSTDWKTFADPKYSVQYPITWELNQSGAMGTSIIILSPMDSNMDKFRENMNVLIQDLSKYGIDLDKYTEISENQIKTMISNVNIIESKRVKVKEGEYHKLLYTGDQGTLHLMFEQYYWVINKNAYVLTFTSEIDKHKGLNEIIAKILSSFVIK